MIACQCGCGEQVKNRFVKGHNIGGFGTKHTHWKGGKYTSHGYRLILRKGHPRAQANGYVSEHIFIAEKVFGKPLPPKAVVHHVDGDCLNNSKDNLVICEDQAYHHLLHKRKRALDSCGHAGWLKCWICKQYDDPKNMYKIPDRNSAYHKKCHNEYKQKTKGGMKNDCKSN